MFDKRKPLPQGWELVFGEEHRYVIAEEIGRGGSCIVYNGFYRDRYDSPWQSIWNTRQ